MFLIIVFGVICDGPLLLSTRYDIFFIACDNMGSLFKTPIIVAIRGVAKNSSIRCVKGLYLSEIISSVELCQWFLKTHTYIFKTRFHFIFTTLTFTTRFEPKKENLSSSNCSRLFLRSI